MKAMCNAISYKLAALENHLGGVAVLDLFIKWKPDWLYHVMPYIYSLIGLAAIYYFDTPTGYGAGALLLLAACLIWMARKENRTH
jgi:hypothetical protein